MLVSLAIQVGLIVHIIKTGRNTMWIWIVLLIPLAGTIAYLLIELLPDLMGSRTGRRAQHGLKNFIDPNRDLNQAAARYEEADTVANRMLLGRECLQKGMFEQAKSMFESSLTGPHRDDPDLLLGLAEAEFGLGNPARSKSLLDTLIAQNPDYKNQEGHLLYARSLAALEQWQEAAHEFEVLKGYYSGPQAKYYYAQILQQQQRLDKAMELYREIINTAARNRHYRDLNKPLLASAQKALKQLEAQG